MNPPQPFVGILLVNLGTPEAPTAQAVRRYLAQFLSDKRVVDLPGWLWKPVLRGIILRSRPAKSAQKYAKIWTEEGSPLLVHTKAQAKALQSQLNIVLPGQCRVEYAMRYGLPAVHQVLDEMVRANITKFLVLPLYPQYSSTSTASVFDAVYAWGAEQRDIPELRFVNDYHDMPAYIQALASQVQCHWQQNGRSEHLLISFHGVPQRTVEQGDPYQAQCLRTAELLGRALQIESGQYSVTFQSRFGKAKWIEPATQPALCELGRQGVKSVDVICPGFSSDCLETLEEINMECREAFLESGGEVFQYIPCLNAQPEDVEAMKQLVLQHLHGWSNLNVLK